MRGSWLPYFSWSCTPPISFINGIVLIQTRAGGHRTNRNAVVRKINYSDCIFTGRKICSAYLASFVNTANTLHRSHVCLANFVGIANLQTTPAIIYTARTYISLPLSTSLIPTSPPTLHTACTYISLSVFTLPISLTSPYITVPRSSPPLRTSVHRSLDLLATLAESANPLSRLLNYWH